MPIAIQKSAEEADAKVRVVKFVKAIWLDDAPRINLILLFENAEDSRKPFSFFSVLFPFTIDPENLENISQTLLEDSPLNRYKRGPYTRGHEDLLIKSYDGVPDIRVVPAQLRLKAIPAEAFATDTPGSELLVSFQDYPIAPGERVGFRLTFLCKPEAGMFEGGMTYSRTRSNIVFSTRMFDGDILGTVGRSEVSSDREIPCSKLFDEEKHYGGFDIVAFIPSAYSAATMNPPAEGFGHAQYDYLGRPADPYLKYVWRARNILGSEPLSTPVRFGSRMVLHGAFLNFAFFTGELRTTRDSLGQAIESVGAITQDMLRAQALSERTTRLSLQLARVALTIAFLGIVATVLSILL